MSYQSTWIAKRDQILAAALRIKTQHPSAWEEVKVPGQSSRRFIGLVAEECQRTVSGEIGCNLKRGGPAVSLDVLAMPNASGATDASGTYPGLELIDIIGNAERPDASLTWGDVTQKTIDAGVPGGWIKSPASPSSAPPVPAPPAPQLPPGRSEALDELVWLDGYYAAPDGLQRPQGLSLDGRPDFEGVAAWYLDVYQRARLAGQSREAARAAYVDQIRASDEWRAKHPGGR